MVVPNSWSKPLSMKPSSLNKQLNDVMFGNTLIDYNLDVSEFFNVGVVTSTFLLRKDGIGAATRFLVSKHQDLAQKILTDAEDCFICADETPWRRFPVSDTPSKNAKFPIRMKKKIAYSEFDDPVRRLPKLIFPRELGYYVFADDVGEYGFNNQGRAMIFETASQVKSAFSFFDSQIVRWIVRTFSWTPQSDFVLLSMIRRPVFDRVFNDEDILNHFNLTKIEQAQIKAALK